MQPVFYFLCTLVAVSSGQEWQTTTAKSGTLHHTATTTYPWVTSSPGSWENEVCTMVPDDERFLILDNYRKYDYEVSGHSRCFKQGGIVEVTVFSYTYYTGFILQARSIWDWDTTPYGSFSLGKYSDGVAPRTCGHGYDNVMMTYETDYYTNHTFYWHAPYDLQSDIIFNATVINEWEEGGFYVMNVTSEVVEYNPFCDDIVVSGGNSLKSGGFLAILSFILMELMM